MVREVVSWEQSFKVRRRRWCAVVKTKNLNIAQIFNYFQFFHFFFFFIQSRFKSWLFGLHVVFAFLRK